MRMLSIQVFLLNVAYNGERGRYWVLCCSERLWDFPQAFLRFWGVSSTDGIILFFSYFRTTACAVLLKSWIDASCLLLSPYNVPVSCTIDLLSIDVVGQLCFSIRCKTSFVCLCGPRTTVHHIPLTSRLLTSLEYLHCFCLVKWKWAVLSVGGMVPV